MLDHLPLNVRRGLVHKTPALPNGGRKIVYEYDFPGTERLAHTPSGRPYELVSAELWQVMRPHLRIFGMHTFVRDDKAGTARRRFVARRRRPTFRIPVESDNWSPSDKRSQNA